MSATAPGAPQQSIHVPGALGILGGMGPLATADFFAKLIALTPAARDDDHVPVLIASLPAIPPRVPAILAHGASPLPALLAARDRLLAAGATMLAMPCNTAHHWFDALADCAAPMLHIADAAMQALEREAPSVSSAGLVATRGTLHSGFYQRRLLAAGLTPVEPDEALLAGVIEPAVAAVKAGAVAEGGRGFQRAAQALHARGAQGIILACTEVPPALAAVGPPAGLICVDATAALARACIDAWRARHSGGAATAPDPR
jgi:aspartate racemase